MKRVQMIVARGKHEVKYLIGRTREEFAAALRYMFEANKAEGYYHRDYMESRRELDLLEEAESGDSDALAMFMRLRREHEYEGWGVETLLVPDEADDSEKGSRCECGSDMISGHSIDIVEGEARQEVNCLVCGKAWTNVYAWSGIEK